MMQSIFDKLDLDWVARQFMDGNAVPLLVLTALVALAGFLLGRWWQKRRDGKRSAVGGIVLKRVEIERMLRELPANESALVAEIARRGGSGRTSKVDAAIELANRNMANVNVYGGTCYVSLAPGVLKYAREVL